jgi:hypothetical protein
MRTTLGVIAAFILMAAATFGLSIAPWYFLGLDRVMLPGRFETTTAVTGYSVLVGIAAALAAGWACARITGSRNAVIALAVFAFVAGFGNFFGQRAKPEPGARAAGLTVGQAMTQRKEPAWFTLLMPCVGLVGIIVGGRVGQG